jgi:hypothetical protein
LNFSAIYYNKAKEKFKVASNVFFTGSTQNNSLLIVVTYRKIYKELMHSKIVMRITKRDFERWKESTLAIARDMSLDENILTMLRGTPVEVIPKDSGSMFYGWAKYEPPKVEVYETNPSKYFPRKLWEVWNQSGMDHELIGHIYNFYADSDHDESGARRTQVEMAEYRGKNSFFWRIAAKIEPAARKFQEYRKRVLYKR